MKKRGFLDISFAWLFAIIAGAIIIVLAIFVATKVINLGQQQVGASSQAELGTLLNPLETGYESGQITTLTFPAETRIYNQCDSIGVFGKEIISVSQQSFGQWPAPTSGTAFQNKYIFSDNISEGKNFILFSKPFDFPFKVADLIYLTPASVNYCFINPPSSINDELSTLNQQNILLADDISNCSSGSITVCFDNSVNCNVNVNYVTGTVMKGNNTLTFSGDALMYAAIFSDKIVYECQVKRLMERGIQLDSLYTGKANLISYKGCNSDLGPSLLQLSSLEGNLGNSNDLNGIIGLVNQIQNDNDLASCKLW